MMPHPNWDHGMNRMCFSIAGLALLLASFFSVSAQEVEWNRVSDRAPWCPRDSGGNLVFQGKMWMLGGFSGDVAGESLYQNIWQMEEKRK